MIEEKWVEELSSQIVSGEDKELFNEAVGCFRAGHYRASFIISWISIVESLKRKIKEFADLDDKRAKEAFEKIEKNEALKQSVDKLIFEQANFCGIIDNSEISKISFLWEQRCLFAHPYNIRPEPNEVEYIINQSVKLSLGRELYYNKSFLDELIGNIINKSFFLSNDIDQIRNYANRIIARIPQALHPYFFKKLLAAIGDVLKIAGKFYELRKLRYFIVELFLVTPLSLDDTQWSLENRVTNFPYESYIGFVHKDIWTKLPDRIKEMLISYVISEDDRQKLSDLNSITSDLIKHNVLEEKFSNVFIDKLNNLSFDFAIDFYDRNQDKLNRLKTQLRTYQYDSQNFVIDYLKTEDGIKFVNELNKSESVSLGRLLKSSASNNHWKTQNYISSIEDGKYVVPDWLKAGIVYGSFVSMQDKFYFDEKTYDRAVNILNLLPQNVQNEIYKEIAKVVEFTLSDEWDKVVFDQNEFLKKSSETISSVEWSNIDKESYGKLVDQIKGRFV